MRFFQPQCRFLLFHDIWDYDAHGVRAVWSRLKTQLLRARDARIASDGPAAAAHLRGSWAVDEGYFVKECTQQVATRRRNFGLGVISAQRLQSSWLD